MARFGFYIYSDEDDFRSEAEFLAKANCRPILSHRYTNANDEIPPLMEIIKNATEEDILVVRSLEKMVASVGQLSKVLEHIVKKRMHLKALEQKPIDTSVFTKDIVYFYLQEFCDVKFNFISNSIRKAERTKSKRYKGWNEEKVERAINVFDSYKQGLKISDLEKIFGISYSCARKYIQLVDSGEINDIRKSINQKKIKKPIGRAEGPIKSNRSKPEMVKILHGQNMRAMDIQAQLKISKGTYYRYLRMA